METDYTIDYTIRDDQTHNNKAWWEVVRFLNLEAEAAEAREAEAWETREAEARAAEAEAWSAKAEAAEAQMSAQREAWAEAARTVKGD